MRIKTIIVDDEMPLCNELEYLLQSFPDFQVTGKFDQPREALQYIAQERPDLVFLDIKMPGMTGLEFAACISEMDLSPLLVFVTAYESYALDAFTTPAVGYITKPISPIALSKTLSKVKKLLSRDPHEQEQGSCGKITLSREGKMYPVSKDDIVMAYTRNKEVMVRLEDGDYYSPVTLQEMADSLDTSRFMQIHRQYIVNLDHVSQVIPWFNGAYMLQMKGFPEEKIPVSRNHIQEVKARLGFK